MTIVGRADLEHETLEEVIAFVQENGEDVMYANAGIGAASHLCGLLFMNAIDTQMTTIPYQGTGPAMTDLMGGQVDLMCDQTTNTTNQIRDGSIKAFAVTVPERLDSLPDLPTADESGLPGFEVSIWHGLYAPAGTPDEVVERLSQALQAALETRRWWHASPISAQPRPRGGCDTGGLRASSKARSSSGARSSRLPASTPTDAAGR
jgi:tripartite-type tricarboxylate transporter receptor subunit TctC